MKYTAIGILSVLTLSSLISCTESTEKSNIIQKEVIKIDEVEEASTGAHIVRLDKELAAMKSPQDLAVIYQKYPSFFAQYLGAGKRKPTQEDFDRLYQLFSNPELLMFYQDIDKYFGKFETEEKELNELVKYTKHYFPNYNPPTFYTIYAGLMEPDISVSDSSVFICLDWFMGSKGKYRPNIYEYMLSRYDKPFMVPMLATATSTQFIEQNKADQTLIADMIYFGKAHYFTERVIPELPDSINIGYTSQDIQGIDENMSVIWSHFIDHKLFYETSHRIKEQYIGEAPFVNEISNKCPGRIGRWLGWQIVRKYMQTHPDVTLEQLMKDTDAAKIFKESGYKPTLATTKK